MLCGVARDQRRLLGGAVLVKRARAACRCRFCIDWLQAGSRKTKMDAPHARVSAMNVERFEGFRDRSVARETCLELASVLQGARAAILIICKKRGTGSRGSVTSSLDSRSSIRLVVLQLTSDERSAGSVAVKEPICAQTLESGRAARERRATLTARSKTQNTPL